jgi:AraC-like DNA-binding protein
MDTRIEAARKIIEEEYQKTLTVMELATRAGLSRSYFEFLFTEQMGHSPMAYLRAVRLCRGAESLGREHSSVKLTALTVGYRHIPNFHRDFKKRFGVTPCEYRREHAERPTARAA